LTINQTPRPENHEKIEQLSKAVLKLQEDVNAYKTVSETITEENKDLKEQVKVLNKNVVELTASIAPFRKLSKDQLKKFLVVEDE